MGALEDGFKSELKELAQDESPVDDLGRQFLEKRVTDASRDFGMANLAVLGGLGAGLPITRVMERSLNNMPRMQGKVVGLTPKGKAMYLAGKGALGLAGLGAAAAPILAIRVLGKSRELPKYEAFKEKTREQQAEEARRLNMDNAERMALERDEKMRIRKRIGMMLGLAGGTLGLGALLFRKGKGKAPAPARAPAGALGG